MQQDLEARRVSGEGIDENSRKRYRLALNRCTCAAANLSEHLAAHRFLPRRSPTIKIPNTHPRRLRIHIASPIKHRHRDSSSTVRLGPQSRMNGLRKLCGLRVMAEHTVVAAHVVAAGTGSSVCRHRQRFDSLQPGVPARTSAKERNRGDCCTAGPPHVY